MGNSEQPVIFSRPIQYAIRAVTYLGEQVQGRLFSIRKISEAEHIPTPYLAKIVNRLSSKHLVSAKRGPSGGVKLARPANRITVDDIVNAMGGSLINSECILGISECGDQTPCPVHESWKAVRQVLVQSLQEQTVADLVQARRAKQSSGSDRS
jgi:Rrf2 family iron-sulfur cluster assembly transcriptional regulator